MNTYKLILDKERELKYSNRSFMELEKLTGKPVLSIMAEIHSLPDDEARNREMIKQFSSAQFITDFIYAGLIHEKVSYDTVCDMIPASRYMELMAFPVKVIMAEFGLEAKSTETSAQPATQVETAGEKKSE